MTGVPLITVGSIVMPGAISFATVFCIVEQHYIMTSLACNCTNSHLHSCCGNYRIHHVYQPTSLPSDGSDKLALAPNSLNAATSVRQTGVRPQPGSRVANQL